MRGTRPALSGLLNELGIAGVGPFDRRSDVFRDAFSSLALQTSELELYCIPSVHWKANLEFETGG